jgi:hypothetical protein
MTAMDRVGSPVGCSSAGQTRGGGEDTKFAAAAIYRRPAYAEKLRDKIDAYRRAGGTYPWRMFRRRIRKHWRGGEPILGVIASLSGRYYFNGRLRRMVSYVAPSNKKRWRIQAPGL